PRAYERPEASMRGRSALRSRPDARGQGRAGASMAARGRSQLRPSGHRRAGRVLLAVSGRPSARSRHHPRAVLIHPRTAASAGDHDTGEAEACWDGGVRWDRMNRMSPVLRQSEKLRDVLYDIRGPVSARAAALEAEGHRILKLNIGNPQPFGFDAPSEILQDVIAGLSTSAGYSDSRGIQSARRAVVHHYQL